MAADIQQHNLFFKYCQSKRYAVTVCQANRIAPQKLALQRMHLQMRREWIVLNINDEAGKPGLKIRMSLKEPASLSHEALGGDNTEHYSLPSSSMAFKS